MDFSGRVSFSPGEKHKLDPESHWVLLVRCLVWLQHPLGDASSIGALLNTLRAQFKITQVITAWKLSLGHQASRLYCPKWEVPTPNHLNFCLYLVPLLWATAHLTLLTQGSNFSFFAESLQIVRQNFWTYWVGVKEYLYLRSFRLGGVGSDCN